MWFDRQLKKAFLLACALLTLVLPAVNIADTQLASHDQQETVRQPDEPMTSDIGLAGSGLAGDGKAVLKPCESFVRDRGTTNSSLKAIAGEKQFVSSIDLLSNSENAQIHIQVRFSGASLCCRAPPAFSRL